MAKKNVTVTFEADPIIALALAQFVKRIGWDEIEVNAQDKHEAYQIKDGIYIIQNALAEAGYSPR